MVLSAGSGTFSDCEVKTAIRGLMNAWSLVEDACKVARTGIRKRSERDRGHVIPEGEYGGTWSKYGPEKRSYETRSVYCLKC
jgi:hypothetical protein